MPASSLVTKFVLNNVWNNFSTWLLWTKVLLYFYITFILINVESDSVRQIQIMVDTHFLILGNFQNLCVRKYNVSKILLTVLDTFIREEDDVKLS